MLKPLLNLFTGEKGAKAFRRGLSDKQTENKKDGVWGQEGDGGASAFVEMVSTALEESLRSEVLDEVGLD